MTDKHTTTHPAFEHREMYDGVSILCYASGESVVPGVAIATGATE